MEYCTKCGAENDDGFVFCYQCGAKNAASAPTAAAAPAREALRMAYAGGADSLRQGLNTLTQDRSAGMTASRNLSEALIDPDEQVIAQLGNGYAASYLASGGVGTLNATLTDRRVYFKGKLYNGKERLGGIFRIWRNFRNLFKRSVKDQILDVRDVTGTWFEYNDDLWNIIMAILNVVACIVAIIVGIGFRDRRRTFGYDYYNSPRRYLNHYNYNGLARIAFGVAILLLVVGVIWLLNYFKSRYTSFCIEYAGGVISFRADIVGVAAVRDFHRQLRLAKDRHMDMQEGRW